MNNRTNPTAMENKNKPAYPIVSDQGYVSHESSLGETQEQRNELLVGLSKREIIAAMCLQGLLANPEFLRTRIDRSPVEEAIKWTDDFLTQIENK